MVRCVENLVNTYVFLKLQISEFSDIWGSTGTAWDLILEAFRMPGTAFWWSGRVLGIWCDMAALAGWAGGVPGFRTRLDLMVKWMNVPQDQQYNRLLDWDYRTEGLKELKDRKTQN